MSQNKRKIERMNTLENLFKQAEEFNKKDSIFAKSIYEKIIDQIGVKDICEMDTIELRYFALSKMRIFLSTNLNDTESSEEAIGAFELFFRTNDNDAEMYSSYILLLELTYQYKRAYYTLLEMLKNEKLKPSALTFLSSYVYCSEGLQSNDECIAYEKQHSQNE